MFFPVYFYYLVSKLFNSSLESFSSFVWYLNRLLISKEMAQKETGSLRCPQNICRFLHSICQENKLFSKDVTVLEFAEELEKIGPLFFLFGL